jgi:aminopeptidase N
MIRIIFTTLLILTLPGIPRAGEPQHDTLPLGESRYRYDLAKIEAGQIFETESRKVMGMSDLVDAAAASDIFVIGEFHNSMDCHLFQKRFIRALYQKYPKIVVGFEFFNREDDPLLEQWRTGEIEEEELLKRTEWYKRTALNYGYTREVMDIIREYKIPVIGLNVSREILRTVSRKGFESLSEGEKKLFPLIDVPNEQHRYLIKMVFGDFATQVPMWFENVYTAQKCWDVVMAESMRKILNKPEFRGFRGIIIAGNFHVAYGLGIPFRYRRAQKRLSLTTIVPVALGSEEQGSSEESHPMKKMFEKQLSQTAVFSRGIGDYVFSVSLPESSYFPELGFKCKKVGDSLQVSQVSEKGFAQEYGIEKGDVIHSVDGIRVTSLEQFRLLCSLKKWDESIHIGLEKKINLRKKDLDPEN